ncbi:IbrA [Streptococcus phage CHPC877]|uniref:IbrA n=1 Tax=Streptococcus phage CHPC877 TaxID=2365044 RepID=A0A3G8F7H2_9CAUD|nr:IbrA [Streptococcus phage CHPC877]AZF90731.1 IbrA [Streptococcus phage CHPC877]
MKTVYDLAMERIKLIFDEFDHVYISFSGGKDSGVMLNLALKYLKDNNINRKVTLMHLDYEAQYEMTTEYVQKMEQEYADYLNVYHVCVPFKVHTCTSMFQSYWRPWEEDKRDIWVRELPDNAMVAADFDFYQENMWDYEFQEKLSTWIHEKEKVQKTAVLVGIRTQESLHRWRAIHKERDTLYNGLKYSKLISENVYNFYPIYDWKTEDIWVANAKFGFEYNKLYDLYYQAGVPIDSMRVASPFLSEGQESLKLYKVIEPHTWGKLVSRVNGVNFTGLYGGTTALGWRKITKPDTMTWKEYMEFLLDTLPENTRANYLAKLETSIRFWKEKGGLLSDETIQELDDLEIKYEIGSHGYKSDKKAVKLDYLDDIDIKDFKSIPTYKRMCICILKNDHTCKYMGFSQTKTEMMKRKEAVEKYANIL